MFYHPINWTSTSKKSLHFKRLFKNIWPLTLAMIYYSKLFPLMKYPALQRYLWSAGALLKSLTTVSSFCHLKQMPFRILLKVSRRHKLQPCNLFRADTWRLLHVFKCTWIIVALWSFRYGHLSNIRVCLKIQIISAKYLKKISDFFKRHRWTRSRNF